MIFARLIKYSLFVLAVVGTLTSCRIDEDLSDCGVSYRLQYDVSLRTNVQTMVEAELTSTAEHELGKRLQSALSGFFAEYAQDVDLAFYTLDKPQSMRHHEHHVIGGKSATYSIYMPAENYRHLSVANVDAEPAILHNPVSELAGDYKFESVAGDTIDSHTVGLFSARLDMEVTGEEDQEFNVSLYMQNAAMALVMEPLGQRPAKVEMFLTDLATGFDVNDSLYIYNEAPMVRTHELKETGSHLMCLYGTGFPSREAATAAPSHQRATKDDALWRVIVNVTLADGTITQTELYIPDALKAGHLYILKTQLLENGALVPARPEVGASVELDWNPGGEYNPIL
ncbi:MAG: hypothetical protein II200_07690 [Bacteroidaceae bacterium]|nr:hypothetical protein [Bacteroidaceae bacterium]